MSDAVQEGTAQAEFVRLSIKLDVVYWPFDNGIMLKILQDNGYTGFEQRPEFVKATRAGGEFIMERLRQVITFSGFPLSAVVGAKKNFEESLETNTGVVLGDHVAYYENEYVLVYLAKKSINDVLANVYSGSSHMKSIRDIVRKEVRPSCIDVSSHGSHHDKTWCRIKVEPKVEGTDKTYFCSAVYRDTSIDNVISDAEDAVGVVKGLLSMLEGRTDKSAGVRA